MRITLGMMNGRIKSNLMGSAEEMLHAQDVASTGKRIQRPSDDIPGAGRVMSLNTALAEIAQFSRNTEVATTQLNSASTALGTVVARMQEVRKLALQGTNPSLTPEGRTSISVQLKGISEELASVANTQTLGRYIFSGSLSNVKPFVETTTGNEPYNYAGDQGQLTIQISPGNYATTTVNGDSVFNMNGAAAAGAPDIFTMLKNLSELVEAGDTAGISSSLTGVDANLNNVIASQAQIGARQARLSTTKENMLDAKVSTENLLSKTRDADMAEAIIDLQTKQNVYQAALSTAGKVIQQTLVDYMN